MGHQYAKLFEAKRDGHPYQVLVTKEYDPKTEEYGAKVRTCIKGKTVEGTLGFLSEEGRDQFFERMNQDVADGALNQMPFSAVIDDLVGRSKENGNGQ